MQPPGEFVRKLHCTVWTLIWMVIKHLTELISGKNSQRTETFKNPIFQIILNKGKLSELISISECVLIVLFDGEQFVCNNKALVRVWWRSMDCRIPLLMFWTFVAQSNEHRQTKCKNVGKVTATTFIWHHQAYDITLCLITVCVSGTKAFSSIRTTFIRALFTLLLHLHVSCLHSVLWR